MNRDNVKGDCILGGEGCCRMGNQGTSANNSSHTESSWRLNELTERGGHSRSREPVPISYD